MILQSLKIAFVTPWYGREIPGGAESEARRTAQKLHQAGYAVEVFTTCIRDFFADWGKNYHKPGVETIDDIPVRRFRVEKRDKRQFDELNRQLMQGRHLAEAAEHVFINEMIRTPTLYEHIKGCGQEYIFFFIPYMFATTYFGAQICPERSAVIPCLHDEPYAFMNIFQYVMPKVRALIFNTASESRLAARLYSEPDSQLRSVVGIGVDTTFDFDATRFREKYQLGESFILYVGRRDPGKNIPLLLDYWGRYAQETGTMTKLVLIGPGEVTLTPKQTPNVVDLGFVPLQDKYDAYAAAELLCQPSLNESFSLVMMESWLTETPVLVHGDCAVTRDHCVQSNGGLYFSNYQEFAATLDYLLANRKQAWQMGQAGRRYVLAHFQWSIVLAKYEQIIKDIRQQI